MTTAVFDAAAVADLTGDPRDAAFAVELVSCYRRLLPERLRRIAAALDGDDPAETLDAVLSLKSASAMVGACELGEVAARVEADVRADAVAAEAAERLLADAAARVDDELAAYLR